MSKPASSHHFVLVHGVGHGAWCWFRLRCLLETAGHEVTCLDLAGAGIHPSDADSILTFQAYDEPLFDFMSSLPKGKKVILVGHSAGGLSVTHAMHEFADKIAVAIFIAATMLPSGFLSEEDKKDEKALLMGGKTHRNDKQEQSKKSASRQSKSSSANNGIPDLSPFGDVHELSFSQGSNNPPTSVALKKEFQRPILYQSTPKEYSTLASMLLRPWPALAIARARFEGGEERVNKVRRVFVKTTTDNMVKPEQQDAMIRRWPPNEVLVAVGTDHSPFFSDPEQLFNLIMKASSS